MSPQIAEEHARWAGAIRSGRPSALPGNELLRVRHALGVTGIPGSDREGG
jgi:hypothetical protein